MGNGDRKSRKGKIRLGSFGVRRLRKKHKNVVSKPIKVKTPEIIAEVKHNVKPEVVIKPKVHPKEETPVILTEVNHEVIAEKKVKTEPKVEPKAKTESKTKVKEKAEPKAKAKEKTEPKAAPKAKKTKKEN